MNSLRSLNRNVLIFLIVQSPEPLRNVSELLAAHALLLLAFSYPYSPVSLHRKLRFFTFDRKDGISLHKAVCVVEGVGCGDRVLQTFKVQV